MTPDSSSEKKSSPRTGAARLGGGSSSEERGGGAGGGGGGGGGGGRGNNNPLNITISINSSSGSGGRKRSREEKDGEALLEAASHNSVRQIRDLVLQHGVPVDWSDRLGGGGQTALHLAAIAGHVDAVQTLIELGAALNKVNDISGASALHLAAFGRGTREHKMQVISALVKAGADCFSVDRYGSQPWHYAHDEEMRVALKGPDFRLHKAILSRQLEMLAHHLQALEYPEQVNELGQDGNAPLHLAAAMKVEEATKILLEAGANPNERNEQGVSPMHTAASVLWEEGAELLLQAGASINMKSILVDEYSSKGGNWVAPELAAATPASSPRGSMAVAVAAAAAAAGKGGGGAGGGGAGGGGAGGGGGGGSAVQKPSPRNRKDYTQAAIEHETPLHICVRKGGLSMTRFLLERGADINATDREGKTPLYLALEQLLVASRIGNTSETQNLQELVKMLIEHGASPLIGSSQRSTLLHWSVMQGQVDALELLVSNTFGRTRQRLLDAQDEEGNTALMLAARENKVGCLEALLRNGSDATVVNEAGQTARDLAEGAALCILETFSSFAGLA